MNFLWKIREDKHFDYICLNSWLARYLSLDKKIQFHSIHFTLLRKIMDVSHTKIYAELVQWKFRRWLRLQIKNPLAVSNSIVVKFNENLCRLKFRRCLDCIKFCIPLPLKLGEKNQTHNFLIRVCKLFEGNDSNLLSNTLFYQSLLQKILNALLAILYVLVWKKIA